MGYFSEWDAMTDDEKIRNLLEQIDEARAIATDMMERYAIEGLGEGGRMTLRQMRRIAADQVTIVEEYAIASIRRIKKSRQLLKETSSKRRLVTTA